MTHRERELTALALALADRVFLQSELLSRIAEKPMKKRTLPPEVYDQHIALLGKTRSGKSSVMRAIVEDMLTQRYPVCIVDPKGDWWGIKLSADGKKAGFPLVVFGGAHADVQIDSYAGAPIAELFATGNRPCLIDMGGWMPNERTRFWIDFASTLFRNVHGKRYLVIDEIHNFAPKGKVFDPDSGKALHWTNRLAAEGLGKGIQMTFASQRPQKVHNDTLTSAETLIAMKVLHPADRDAVSDWIKGCGDPKAGAAVIESLSKLERGEGWLWSPEAGIEPTRTKFPFFRTYDSFRPQSAEDTKRLSGWPDIDLDEVKAKLAPSIERAKDNDPKALKAELAKLQAQLAATKVPAVVETTTRVDVPIFEPGQVDDLRAVAEDFRAVAAGIVKTLETCMKSLGAKPRPNEQIKRDLDFAIRKAVADEEKGEALDRSQAVLDTIRMLENRGITITPLSVARWLDLSPTTGSFKKCLRTLRERGCLDGMKLTEVGYAAARPIDIGYHAAKEAVVYDLPVRMLGIIKAEDPITKDDLAKRLEMSPTTGSFKGGIRRLREMGLIDVAGQTMTLTAGAGR